MLEVLHQLSPVSLRALAGSLRGGLLAGGLSRYAAQQIAGPRAGALEICLESLLRTGMTPAHIALMAEALADSRDRQGEVDALFDLVLSGPDVPGIPTADTAAVMHALIEQATEEVLLVGYAVHNGRKLFPRLAEKMAEVPGFRVVFCLDIARKYGDTSLASEIVRRFIHEFRTHHWPWPELPELYYDPRSLDDSRDQPSSLHAKCIVVDRRVALVTSANFTEAAQQRNIEAGVLVRYPPFAERLAGFFEGLQASGRLARCPLD